MSASRTILDHPAITSVLFYPRRIPEAMAAMFPEGEVVRIPSGSETLGGLLHAKNPGGPTFLFFHGNGEIMTDYFMGFHRKIAELGANLLVVDYRGYGLSSGRPTLSGLLEDARASIRYVTEDMKIEPGKLVVMGRSLGSLAALEAVDHGPGAVAGLVIESGIGRMNSWVSRMGPWMVAAGLDTEKVRMALQADFDHEGKMRSFLGRILVMHAPFDEIVPVENAHDLASWGEPTRTRLHVFALGTHNDIQFVNEREYFRTLGEFLVSAGF